VENVKYAMETSVMPVLKRNVCENITITVVGDRKENLYAKI